MSRVFDPIDPREDHKPAPLAGGLIALFVLLLLVLALAGAWGLYQVAFCTNGGCF